ncbi:MAG: ABC transporter ATP-binding protein [Gemmatimonadota bacterium]
MSVWRRFIAQLRPYRGQYALAIALYFVASVLDGAVIVLIIPLFKRLFGTAGALSGGQSGLERFTERVLGPVLDGTTPEQAVLRVCGLLVAALLLKNAASYAAGQLSVGVQEGVVRDLRTKLFSHLMTLDLQLFQRMRSGQLLQRVITDVDQAKSVVSATLARLLQNVFEIAVAAAILISASWRLTLLAFIGAPLLILGMQFLVKRLRRHSRARADEWGEITSHVSERLGAMKLIRSYGAEEQERARFYEQATTYRKRVIRTQRYSTLTSPVSELFGGMVLVMILWGGTRAVGGGELTPQTLIAFLITALRMMSPIKSLSQFPASVAVALASADRVYQLLDTPSTEVDAPNARPARFERDIVFDHVRFRYGEDREVLHDVSFTIGRGEVVALVGPSGSGKTTLVEMLPRLHDPTEGAVKLDGVPLTALTRRSLRSLMGMVSQDTVLLNDTVRNNITFGHPGATDAQVETAARAANAHDFIAQLPEAYGTVLGERGTRLSGGQRQRIAIARALLRDPPILLLDEATSALDTESERLVQEAIERLMQDRTAFVIAHRLATVRDADRILVLEEGRVVEQGTHDELYRQGGLYRRLYDLQFREEPTA